MSALAKSSEGSAEANQGSPTQRNNLEKLVARLEREREDLTRQLAEVQESARANARGAEIEIEEYKAQVKQLNEKLNEKVHGVDAAIEEKIKQLNQKFAEEQERAEKAEKERDEMKKERDDTREEVDEVKVHLEASNILVATLQKECDEAKDTFNTLQKKAEDDKGVEARRLEAIQEELQNNFQAERDLLKGISSPQRKRKLTLSV